ncbi:hypothetical protein OP10G_0522 [Fimbriimonas ginsengisoli Gsoil 348]|uniref:Uncharacterized protein n=1 Tax=Fimbriimonas ginsengisoli Gsoil 348 TaxID=661478 RepID=A0A068NM77_FIMGI|nr:hypothetical protein OP10G_0522 [Fimbriimonas ginsengisoli Gsoil 348]
MRFVAFALVSLLVVILSLSLLSAIGAPRYLGIGVVLLWMAFLGFGSPTVLILRAREDDEKRRQIRQWESDPRRLAVERLGFDLVAGRVTPGLTPRDLTALDDAAANWRQSRDTLETLTWARGPLAELRSSLRKRSDDAMLNLLAEAGVGHSLGPSPFLIERARELFTEIGAEASEMARNYCPTTLLATDTSLESLREDLDKLRLLRQAYTIAERAIAEALPVESPEEQV